MLTKIWVRPTVFYGWWIAIAAAVANGLSGGFYFYGFSTFFVPLVEEFGWSHAALAGAFSLSRAEAGIMGPVGGYLVDRFGPKKMMFLGILLAGAGFALLPRVNSLTSFYLVFVFLVAVGASLGMHVPGLVATANWFIKRRARALGLFTAGTGVGALLVPGLGWLIVEYGWRTAALVAALVIWGIGLPLASLMRHRPEQYGYLPDGETTQTQQDSPPMVAEARSHTVSADKRGRSLVDFTTRQALATGVFWSLAIAFGLRQMVVSSVVVHQIPFMVSVGISQEMAATMLGALGFMSVAGRFGFGLLGDAFEKRYLIVACMGFLTIGCLILSVVQTWWQVIPFLLIYAPAYGGGATLMFAIRGDYFGRRSFGTISGFMDFVQMLGVVGGPVFAGWMYDVTGSYRLAFVTFALVALVALFLFLISSPPAAPRHSMSRSQESLQEG